MPFDGTDFNQRRDPAPNGKPWGLLGRLLHSVKETALTVAVVLLAFLLSAAAGAAVDGIPDLPSDIPNVPSQSIIAHIISAATFLLTLAGLMWWRVRRLMAE